MSASRENVRYFINYCWFTRDVTAAMLVVCWWSEQSISLLWEPYPIFMKILREKILLYWPPTHIQHGCLVARLQTKKMLFLIYFVSSNERRRRKQQKKSKKELIYEQNNLFTRASRFFIHSLTSLHDSWCDVLWGTLIYDDEFYFLFLNLDKVLKNSTPGESAFIWKIRKGPNRRYKVSNNANSFYHFRRCFHCRRCVVAYAYYWCLLTVLRSCFVVENRLWWCHRIEQNSWQLRCLWR